MYFLIRYHGYNGLVFRYSCIRFFQKRLLSHYSLLNLDNGLVFRYNGLVFRYNGL